MWLCKGKYFLIESLQFLGFFNYVLISVVNVLIGYEFVVLDGVWLLVIVLDNVYKEGDENWKQLFFLEYLVEENDN